MQNVSLNPIKISNEHSGLKGRPMNIMPMKK